MKNICFNLSLTGIPLAIILFSLSYYVSMYANAVSQQDEIGNIIGIHILLLLFLSLFLMQQMRFYKKRDVSLYRTLLYTTPLLLGGIAYVMFWYVYELHSVASLIGDIPISLLFFGSIIAIAIRLMKMKGGRKIEIVSKIIGIYLFIVGVQSILAVNVLGLYQITDIIIIVSGILNVLVPLVPLLLIYLAYLHTKI